MTTATAQILHPDIVQATRQLEVMKNKPVLQLHKTHEFMTLIWKKENPSTDYWGYVRRRLYDLYFFLYWAECQDKEIENDLLFLTNIAAIREGIG